MSENVKIYCGNGKLFGQYGQVGISVCLDDLPNEYITTAKNGKRYISLKVCPKPAPDQFGKTHWVEVDTWKPNGQKKNTSNGLNEFSSEQHSGVPF